MNLTDDNLTAVILAGGLGTRLSSVVKDIPKCMALIRGRPFLEYQIQYLMIQGIHNIVLCVAHLKDKIMKYFSDGREFGVRIQYAVEKELLGTGGAIKNAVDNTELTDYLLILNGDTFANWKLAKIRKTYLEKNADVIMVIARGGNNETSLIEIDEEGKAESYVEKHNNYRGLKYCGVGVYLLHRDLTRGWPSRAFSMEYDCLPRLVRECRVYCEIIDSGFFDIGTPERLESFIRFVVAESENIFDFVQS